MTQSQERGRRVHVKHWALSTEKVKSLAASTLTSKSASERTYGKSGTIKPASEAAGIQLTFQDLEAGVPAAIIRELGILGLNRSDTETIIPARTLERRIQEGQNLRVEEADGLARLLRVTTLAREVFGDPALADQFLRTPHPMLSDAQPIRVARTDLGGREVEAILTRLAQGVFS